jgi:hypothetical protein
LYATTRHLLAHFRSSHSHSRPVSVRHQQRSGPNDVELCATVGCCSGLYFILRQFISLSHRCQFNAVHGLASNAAINGNMYYNASWAGLPPTEPFAPAQLAAAQLFNVAMRLIKGCACTLSSHSRRSLAACRKIPMSSRAARKLKATLPQSHTSSSPPPSSSRLSLTQASPSLTQASPSLTQASPSLTQASPSLTQASPSPPPGAPSTINAGIIVGGVVGSVTGLLLLLAAALFVRRRRGLRGAFYRPEPIEPQRDSMGSIEPFTATTPSPHGQAFLARFRPTYDGRLTKAQRERYAPSASAVFSSVIAPFSVTVDSDRVDPEQSHPPPLDNAATIDAEVLQHALSSFQALVVRAQKKEDKRRRRREERRARRRDEKRRERVDERLGYGWGV